MNFIAPINPSSYGLTGYNLCKSFVELGHQISLFPISGVNLESSSQNKYVEEYLENATTYSPDATCVRLWHQHALDKFVGKGERVGFPIFELDQFNKQERHHLNNVDRLIVCSKWAKNIIEQNDIKVPVDIVPLGHDPEIFYPDDPTEITNVSDKTYKFLNIGKTEIRKGHDVLCEWFNAAFEQDDDVALIISWSNLAFSEAENNRWMSVYKESKLGDKIHFMPRFSSVRQVARLINSCDCLISPSRAEGWNLPLLEGMACNKPVITTQCTAHTEFCTDTNSSLVNIDEYEVAYDGRYFFGQGKWAHLGESQKEQFVSYMRNMYKNQIKENKAGLATAGNLTWKKSAQKLISLTS